MKNHMYIIFIGVLFLFGCSGASEWAPPTPIGIPVDIGIADPSAPIAFSSSANPTSIYSFTTSCAGDRKISITNASISSNMLWKLWKTDPLVHVLTVLPPIIVCDNSIANGDEICTIALDANAKYFLEVTAYCTYTKWAPCAVIYDVAIETTCAP